MTDLDQPRSPREAIARVTEVAAEGLAALRNGGTISPGAIGLAGAELMKFFPQVLSMLEAFQTLEPAYTEAAFSPAPEAVEALDKALSLWNESAREWKSDARNKNH